MWILRGWVHIEVHPPQKRLVVQSSMKNVDGKLCAFIQQGIYLFTTKKFRLYAVQYLYDRTDWQQVGRLKSFPARA